MAGIYLHIPFCKQACYYCDFHFSTNLTLKQDLIGCLQKEIYRQHDYLAGEPIETIYFGGGTPSLLEPTEIRRLLESIHTTFSTVNDVEVTLEANPDDLSLEKVGALRRVGINRLSIGVQSFNNSNLLYFNRAHNAEDSFTSVQNARTSGFNNISLDLIYGIPKQSLADWKADVGHVIALRPEHISAYCLTIEPKTVFGRQAAKKEFIYADESISVQQFELLTTELAIAGYEQYEVSNFCLPGFYSKHNTSYWQRKKYLGIGPSAHSFNGVSRQHNVANNHTYCRSLNDNIISLEIEQLSLSDKVNELLMTGLRTKWGVNLRTLKDEFNYDLLSEQKINIDVWIENQLAFIEDGFLKLTRSGLLVADKISSDLFLT